MAYIPIRGDELGAENDPLSQQKHKNTKTHTLGGVRGVRGVRGVSDVSDVSDVSGVSGVSGVSDVTSHDKIEPLKC